MIETHIERAEGNETVYYGSFKTSSGLKVHNLLWIDIISFPDFLYHFVFKQSKSKSMRQFSLASMVQRHKINKTEVKK